MTGRTAIWELVHLSLLSTGILTFGLLDGVTAILMMEKYGIWAESNSLWREIICSYGPGAFIIFKLFAASMVFAIPFLMYKHNAEEIHWTTACFMSVFIVGGVLAALDNYLYLLTGFVYLQSEVVIGLVLVMTMIALHIGEILDSDANRKGKFKISARRWAELKREIGYPGT